MRGLPLGRGLIVLVGGSHMTFWRPRMLRTMQRQPNSRNAAAMRRGCLPRDSSSDIGVRYCGLGAVMDAHQVVT